MYRPVPIAARMLGAACWIAVFCTPSRAQEFAADILKTEVGGTEPRPSGKLNVSNGRVRLETSDVRAGYFVVHADTGTAWFLRPAAKIFMDAKQSSVLTQMLVSVDPDDPCIHWQMMAKNAGAADRGGEWRCKRVSDDRIDSLHVIKYEAISPPGRRYVAWIDPQLHFSVRLEIDDGAILELANIHEAPQPESLFAIPADYRKFDPQRLIDRMRQSDVWVEPLR